MLIYILLILLTLLYWYIGYKDKNKIKKYFIILCIIFTIVSLFRFEVGTDYVNTYMSKFIKIKLIGTDDHFEILFLLLNKLFILLKLSSVNLIQFCSIITIPLFFRFIKNNLKKEYWFLGALFFIITTIYFATFNLIRQYISIAIMLNVLEYIKKEKYIKYIIFNLIAIGFHYSSIVGIIYLLFYLINKNKNKKNNKILIFFYIISIIFIFIDTWDLILKLETILPNRYKYFLWKTLTRKYSSIFKVFIPNILLILFYKERNKIKKYDKNYKLYLIGLYIYVIINNMFYGINIFKRIIIFFESFLIIVIPKLIEYYNNHKTFEYKNIKIKNFNKLFTLFIIIYYLCVTILGIFINNGSGVIPYKSIFMFLGDL